MNIKRMGHAFISRGMIYINERRGWKTDRKIVVFESDDWGSIRMPDIKVYDKMLKSGLRVDKCPYCRYDTLASKDDFGHLFDVLRKHTDKYGNHPVITGNTIVANPDFKKIKASNFESYFFEPFTETIKQYSNRNFDSWKEGIENKLFFPQFHGREHLNIRRWLSTLQKKSKEVHLAFDNNFFGISSTISNEKNPSFMAALDMDDDQALKLNNTTIEEGLKMFNQIFGYSSESFIAPNYIWTKQTEDILAKNNVKFLQGGFVQKNPLKRDIYNYTGKVNKNKQIYLTRNAVFEPSMLIQKDWISECLLAIDKSFKLHKPAIVCTHRVNFIGGIFESNRTNNLKLFDKLLTSLLNKWPDIEFMNSAELGQLIDKERN